MKTLSVLTLLCFCLSGCSILPSSRGYTPVVARLVNKEQYDKDLEECHWTADNYQPGTSVGSIALGTFNGGTNNGALAVINPLTVLGGAAGGATGAVVSGFGVTGQDSIKILTLCIAKVTQQDGSAIVADPNE